MEKQLLSIGETAAFIGVSIDTLRRWEKEKILKSFRPSPRNNRYYKKNDIDVFLANGLQSEEFDLVSLAENWIAGTMPPALPSQLYCSTSDTFNARLERFGTTLISRPAGKEAFSALQPMLEEVRYNEKIEIDFEGVAVLAPSWADEFVTPLSSKFKGRIDLCNTENPSVQATLRTLEKAGRK
ncbi:MAG: MerR family DNA-binding transcriptional regulator [bacterium]